jgi:hypothetical protein
MDLIRDILIFAEERDDSWFARNTHIGDWSSKDIVYNVGLAVDAGLLDGEDESTLGPDGRDFLIQGLTYYGHEFLDQIRSDTVWRRLKTLAKEQGIDLTVDLVKKLAPKIVATLFDS